MFVVQCPPNIAVHVRHALQCPPQAPTNRGCLDLAAATGPLEVIYLLPGAQDEVVHDVDGDKRHDILLAARSSLGVEGRDDVHGGALFFEPIFYRIVHRVPKRRAGREGAKFIEERQPQPK